VFSVSVGDGAGLVLRLLEPDIVLGVTVYGVKGKKPEEQVDAKLLRRRSEELGMHGVSRHPSLIRRVEDVTTALPRMRIGALFNPVGSHLFAQGLAPRHQIQLLLGVVVGGPGIPRTHDDRRLIPAPRAKMSVLRSYFFLSLSVSLSRKF